MFRRPPPDARSGHNPYSNSWKTEKSRPETADCRAISPQAQTNRFSSPAVKPCRRDSTSEEARADTPKPAAPGAFSPPRTACASSSRKAATGGVSPFRPGTRSARPPVQPQERLMTGTVGSRVRGGTVFPARRSTSRRAAFQPFSHTGWRTVVSGGSL